MEKLKNPLKLYGGEDCVKVFCDYIENKAKRLYHMSPYKPMKRLTREECRKKDRATKCHMCFKEFQKDDKKVRDH